MSTNFTTTMTLNKSWLNNYAAGIELLHKLLHKEGLTTPIISPTPQTFVSLLQDVAGGTYDPLKYFVAGPHRPLAIVDQPPALSLGTSYFLISLNAATPRARSVSTSSGGIAFEDPIWAILAAHACHTTSNPRLALPKAKNNEDLWKNVPTIVDSIRCGTFRPEAFFAPIEGFIPPATDAKFEVITVAAEQVIALRGRGMQALKVSASPKFYELFTL